MNACCSGCSRPPRSSPSIVVTALPAAFATGVWQARTARPSTSTVHAPHWPSPQPYLLPVSASSSRSTLRRLRSPATSTRWRRPFTSSSITIVRSSYFLFAFPLGASTQPLLFHTAHTLIECPRPSPYSDCSHSMSAVAFHATPSSSSTQYAVEVLARPCFSSQRPHPSSGGALSSHVRWPPSCLPTGVRHPRD